MIDRFLIRFGDNDFYFTMMAFGQTIIKAIKDDYRHQFQENLTKERIQILWNETIYGLYLMHQNQWRYDDGDTGMREYLKLRVRSRIYIDEEVDELLEKCSEQSNGDWLICYLGQDPDHPDHTTYCMVI